MAGNKVDPLLQTQLAEAGEKAVEAVLQLRSRVAGKRFPNAEETESLAQELLSQARGETGLDAADYNVFKNLGSLVVVAQPKFLNAVIAHDEVTKATPNRGRGSAKIDPVNKRPAT